MIERIGVLRQVVARVRALTPFYIDAWVVLPEHMHCLWTLPEGDGNFPKRWRAIKTAFSRSVTPGEALSPSRRARGERGIWQRRYWEHTVRDERDYASHMDYIHFNPVKHGVAASAAEWEFSTFQRCVMQGLYRPIGLRPTTGSATGESAGEARCIGDVDGKVVQCKSIAPYARCWPTAFSTMTRQWIRQQAATRPVIARAVRR